MWLMLATSLMGVFAVPAQIVFGLCFQAFVFFIGLNGFNAAKVYSNFDEYEGEI